MTNAERVRALVTTLRMAQWAIDDAAFTLPRGQLSHAKRAELAGILHDLADLLLVALPLSPVGELTTPHDHGREAPITGEWAEETALLSQLGQTWTLWAFGDRKQPEALAAVRIVDATADVIVIRGHDLVTAYRTIISAGGDPLRADTVTWHHTGTALDILREVAARSPSPAASTWTTSPGLSGPRTSSNTGWSARRAMCG